MCGRFWWLVFIVYWVVVYFDWRKFEKNNKEDVKFFVLVVFGFSVIVFFLLIVIVGMWGLFKFWFMFWLVYYFWMSIFIIVYYIVLEIFFIFVLEWNEVEV